MAKKYTTDSITVGGHNLTASMMESLNIVVSNYTNYLTSVPSHNQAWSTITGTPTTLAGYGITDGLSGEHNHDGTYVNVTGDTMTGGLVTPTIRLTNDATNTSSHRVTVYDSGTTSYGMMLWNTNGTDGDWSTMIYGPNQINRRISFGKVTGTSFSNHSDVTEIAYFDLDDSTLRLDADAYVGTNRVFHDGYHPNADKWTTARTISLSGDLTGSVSLDGSANVTLSAQVVNNSHTHDDRYYTESESDSRFVNASGDTMTGTLVVPNLTIGSGNKIQFANNDYIRYDDAANRFHFDADGGTSNASVQAATFVGAIYATSISGNNYNITGVNQLEINDPGEGIIWKGGSSGNITLAVVDDSSDNILRLSGSGAKLEVAGGHITATGGSSNAKNIKLYVNDSWGYLTTSAPRFYLDKEIRVDTGLIGSYDEDLQLRTAGNTKMTLKYSDGNVGINTTTPDARLEVDGGINPYKTLRLTDSTTPGIYFNDLTGTASGDGNFIVASTGGNLYFAVDTNYNDVPSNILATLNDGGNFTLNEGALIVNGSTTRGTYTSLSQYHSGADNIVLKGNSSGISTIFFESEKDGTNINHPSDFGFIQFHPYGTGTSGESNELIIGVSNDSDDHVILNAPNAEGFRVRVGSNETDYKIYHEGHKPTASEIGAQPAGTYNTIIGTDTDINTSGSTIIDNIYVTDGVITSMGTRTLTAGDIGAATSSHNHTYNVNDSWLRDNGDNANVKLYGNSRQMAFRTDGTTEYSSGVGAYAFAWMYGGDSASNRRMLLSSGGDLWTSTSGWLSSALAGKASVSHTHNYAGSTSSGGAANSANKLAFTGFGTDGVTSYQTSGNWQTWTGGWATHIMGNHGNGSTYYNQTIIMPFWGAPQYMRKESGTNVGPYKFWTEENDGSGSGLDADLLDGVHGSSFLRSDATDVFSGDLSNGTSGASISLGYDVSSINNTIGTSGWFRSSGTTGWYNGSYGGGIYMTDTTNVTVYAGKAFRVNNTGTLSIRSAGDIVAYYSDERLKTNLGNITNAVDKVKKLNGFYYTNNDLAQEFGYTEEQVQVGVSAQEVENVMPEVVKPAPFDLGVNEDGSTYSISGDDYKTVKYEKLVPLLIEAIKEQQEQIDELKAIINGGSK